MYVLEIRIVIAGVGAYRERKFLLLLLGGGDLECAGVFWNVVELSGGRAHSPSNSPSRLSADFTTALTPPPSCQRTFRPRSLSPPACPPTFDQRERQRWRSRATAMEQYLRNIKAGPTKFCTRCGGTWFPSQVNGLNIRTVSSKYPNFCLDNAFYLGRNFPSPSGKYLFCNTCRQGVSKSRIPSLCLSNGFDFPEIPECLKNLTCLEERLISPRILFMRIISLGYERQCGI